MGGEGASVAETGRLTQANPDGNSSQLGENHPPHIRIQWPRVGLFVCLFVCVCVCLCVCKTERETATATEKEKEADHYARVTRSDETSGAHPVARPPHRNCAGSGHGPLVVM
jgi:hypothetical protein